MVRPFQQQLNELARQRDLGPKHGGISKNQFRKQRRLLIAAQGKAERKAAKVRRGISIH